MGPVISRQVDELNAFAQAKLDKLHAKDLKRGLIPTSRGVGGAIVRDGIPAISFCDNDYLGLSQNTRVVAAAGAAAIRYGAGAGASRLVSGDSPLNHELETLLAKMKGLEACRVFGSGYMANLGAIPCLVGKSDVVVMDELSHACMRAGAQLSGAEIRTFKHNDVEDARQKLHNISADSRILLMTETVFSMDGDLAPLKELQALCEEYGAWLMTDDAHGFGVIKQNNPALIQMGTLSKAVGVYGGYVCGPAAFIELMISRARTFVFTTGLPPQVLGAALEAVNIINEDTHLAKNVMAKTTAFTDALGLPKPTSTIVPILLGEASIALKVQAKLLEDGFHVSAIRPPTVPDGSSRLRIAFSASHELDDVLALANSLKKHLPKDVLNI
ncbi:aminotransferase class I/II-fold pyridoxal phosphate-dependent enzyme [Hirschia baltica]|uniref:8-amino-7-oxononanoate synthase n=1 Tax=Hirschia baltica (strain ATCC 49814 / DSM 5838 / IFAM 1418) TaxID=582402 RepID=C6XNL0_HIRBI|nr:8-amino-7-oxononanoate synthase [Hirschia baltica]ACT58263.1 8-amino-7-oxononanoate synthase [Hirschia baltica ATCC 49814]